MNNLLYRATSHLKNLPALILMLLFCSTTAVAAADITGWEVGSAYGKLYNYKERDSIKGHIVKFVTVTPMKGMAPGTAIIVDEGGGDKVLVHLGPESFVSARESGLRSGEWVKISGAWADIGNETIFIAAKVKKDNDWSLKLRLTKDGTPFWTMSPERLAKERESD